jgi:phosphatidate cytidylyltransferase
LSETNRNLLLRVGSAVLLAPPVVFLVVKGGLWSAILMGVAAAACSAEYYLITQRNLPPVAWLGALVAMALPIFPSIWPQEAGTLGLWTVTAFFMVAFGSELFREPIEQSVARASTWVTGLLFGSLGLTALAWLRRGPDGVEWVFCCLMATWGNDTSAYFTGRAIGRHKLLPAVSPHKTWEGFAGGLLGSIAFMFLAKAIFFPSLSVADCLIVGVVTGVVGPIGDLSESMLKRAYQVKDSSHIIPGHGGLLDRIDALIFNAPVVLFYAHVLRPWLSAL